MDAIKFIKLWKEMCDSYGMCHDGCPFESGESYCVEFIQKNPEDAVELIRKWSEERRPSMITDFMKRDVEEIKRIIIRDLCPSMVGYESFDECDYGKCEECWNRKVGE